MEYYSVSCIWALLGLGLLLQLQHHGTLGCLEEERIGLLKLKDAFNSSNGSALSSWVDDEESDCCLWERVNCDDTTKQVIQLSLGEIRKEEYWEDWSYYLRSLPIPGWFLNASLLLPFQKLQILNLSYNGLKDFEGVLNLNKLQVLDLNSNWFTELPSLDELRNLKYLDFSHNLLNSNSNHLQGKSCHYHLYIRFDSLILILCVFLIIELTNLSNLEILNLSFNAMTGEIPPSIWALTSLTALSLGWNQLNGAAQGLRGILNLKNLQVLSLKWNWFTELPSLGALINLTYLDFSFNMLKNLNHFQELTSLSNLEVLNLRDTALTGQIPPSVWSLTSLTALSLSSNNLNGTLPAEGLCKLRNLQELALSYNSFEGNLPPCLSNLTSLRLLDFSNNNFVGTIPSTLFLSLNSLQYIALSNNYFKGLFSFSSFANNSKLEVFELTTCNNLLKIETENPPWSPPFQLKILRLSSCTLNEPSGAIPSFLLKQDQLRLIDLSHNKMTGYVPIWLFENNTSLEFLSLVNNSLSGHLDMHRNFSNFNMSFFDVSSNHIKGELPSYMGNVLPNLFCLNMSKNALQGSIPPSVGNMTMLRSLDLSSNNLSGQIPRHLYMGCAALRFLKLSNNNFEGHFLPEKSNLTMLQLIYLDNNNFSGEISPGLLNCFHLSWLNLHSNSISGRIPKWIGRFSYLTTLILSKNSLEGPLPVSLGRLDALEFLDLSWNNFTDPIPSYMNLSSLRFLHLQSNEFTGPIPNFVSRFSSLVTLDLRDNKFSGGIPSWIRSLSNLRILLLKGNKLDGTIPFQLCQLNNIGIIDLSHNDLFGPIPSCLQNKTFGKKSQSSNTFENIGNVFGFGPTLKTFVHENQLGLYQFVDSFYFISSEKEKVEFISKSRSESYRGDILNFMSGIDLSGNKLTGPIPPEIGYLSGIHTLNLSNNHLNGSIPETFSGLKQIESLDLSYNKLSGQIPTQLTELTFLSIFKVAHNNLSGRTPELKNQFGTFEQSSYEGNPLLCGPPLERNCTTTTGVLPPSGHHEEKDLFKVTFSWSFGATYIVAFLGSIAFLYFSTHAQRLLSSFIYEYVLSYL